MFSQKKPKKKQNDAELATAAARATAACAAPAPNAFGSQAPNSKFLNVSLWRAEAERDG